MSFIETTNWLDKKWSTKKINVKMKILVKMRKILQLSGFIPLDRHQNSKLMNLLHNCLTIGIYVYLNISTFVAGAISEDILDLWNNFGSLAEVLAILGSYVTLRWQKNEFLNFVGNLERTVNERMSKSASNKAIYEATNSRNEKFTKFFYVWGHREVLVLIFHRVFTSAYIFLVHGSDSSHDVRLMYPSE